MTPPDQLPAVIEPGALATPTDTYIVPALIANLGDAAGWLYVEFFTANIRNPHTRRAYARACARFFAWCEARGLTFDRNGNDRLRQISIVPYSSPARSWLALDRYGDVVAESSSLW